MTATLAPGTLDGERALSIRLNWPQSERFFSTLSVVSPLLLVAIWESLCGLDLLPSRILPAPSSVIGTALQLISTGELQSNLLVSLTRAGGGFVIGLILGVGLGVAVGIWKLAYALLDRPLQMIRAIPFFAILPLIIIWFGVGEVGKIFLVAMAVLFPVYLNTVLGIRQVDPKLLEVARVARLSQRETIQKIVLPGALPSILNGVRMALATAWLALIVAETIGARSGIGFLANDAREYLRTDVIVLTIFIYAAIGILSDLVARRLELVLLRWHPNFARRSP